MIIPLFIHFSYLANKNLQSTYYVLGTKDTAGIDTKFPNKELI